MRVNNCWKNPMRQSRVDNPDIGNIWSVGGYFDMKLRRRCGDISVWKHF